MYVTYELNYVANYIRMFLLRTSCWGGASRHLNT